MARLITPATIFFFFIRFSFIDRPHLNQGADNGLHGIHLVVIAQENGTLRESVWSLIDVEEREQIALIIQYDGPLTILGHSVVIAGCNCGRFIPRQSIPVGFVPLLRIDDSCQELISLHTVDDEEAILVRIGNGEVSALGIDPVMSNLLRHLHSGADDHLTEGLTVESACVEHGFNGGYGVLFRTTHPIHAGIACMVQAVAVPAPDNNSRYAGAFYNRVRIIFLDGSADLRCRVEVGAVWVILEGKAPS